MRQRPFVALAARVALPAACAVAAALLTTQAGHAATYAQASLGPLQVQVLDLLPSDGLAPWVQLSTPDLAAMASAQAAMPDPSSALLDAQDGTQPWTAIHAQAMQGVAWGQAELQPAGLPTPLHAELGAGVALRAEGRADDFSNWASSSPASFAAQVLLPQGRYTLTVGPGTGLVFQSYGQAYAWARAGDPAGTYLDQALAQAGLRVQWEGSAPNFAEDSVLAQAGSTGETTSQGSRRNLEVQAANTGDTTRRLSLEMWAGSSGQTFVSSVPEPASAWLMLAALPALLALRGGRRHVR
jgi:hypothetical protein